MVPMHSPKKRRSHGLNRARKGPRRPRRSKKLLTGSGHDLVRGWYRWSGVRGCRVGGWMSSTHAARDSDFQPLQPKSRFRFRLPAQTDRAQASGHPKPCRINQQSPPYLQSSSRSSISTLVRRTTFHHSNEIGSSKTTLSPVGVLCAVTPIIGENDARRTTQCMRIDSYACADF